MTIFNYSLEELPEELDQDTLANIEEDIALESEKQIALLSLLESEALAFEKFTDTLQLVEGTKVKSDSVSLESISDELNKLMPIGYSISKESLSLENGNLSISLEGVDKRDFERTLALFQRVISSFFKSILEQIQYTFTWYDGNAKKLDKLLSQLKEGKYDKVDVKVTANKYMYSGNNLYNGDWSDYNRSMRNYMTETSGVRKELRKYIDRNLFGGIKTFFNIVSLNKEKYMENAKEYLGMILKMESDLKMRSVPGMESRQQKMMVSDMYLGMSQYYVTYPEDMKKTINTESVDEMNRHVRRSLFSMDRYNKLGIDTLTSKRDLRGVRRKELISLLEEARSTIESYREFMKLKTVFSSYMKMSSSVGILSEPLSNIILMLLSKNFYLYKAMSTSCFMTIAGTVNHTRGNIKQLLNIAEEVVKEGNRLQK